MIRFSRRLQKCDAEHTFASATVIWSTRRGSYGTECYVYGRARHARVSIFPTRFPGHRVSGAAFVETMIGYFDRLVEPVAGLETAGARRFGITVQLRERAAAARPTWLSYLDNQEERALESIRL